MNNLVINPDQQTGTYNGRKIVAVSVVKSISTANHACSGCVCYINGDCAANQINTKCYGIDREDGQISIWQYAPAGPSDTVCKRCVGAIIRHTDNTRYCCDCGELDTSSDTAMLDWIEKNCMGIAYAKRCEDGLLRTEWLITREDVRKQMEVKV